MSRVEVYVATGCHLCPPTLLAAQEACAARGLEPRVIDIDGDPDLERRYRVAIPVVLVDGVEVGRFAVTAGEIASVLDRTGS
ncbi:MAG: glutaredoxin family protein [Gaiellales bacterium]